MGKTFPAKYSLCTLGKTRGGLLKTCLFYYFQPIMLSHKQIISQKIMASRKKFLACARTNTYLEGCKMCSALAFSLSQNSASKKFCMSAFASPSYPMQTNPSWERRRVFHPQSKCFATQTQERLAERETEDIAQTLTRPGLGYDRKIAISPLLPLLQKSSSLIIAAGPNHAGHKVRHTYHPPQGISLWLSLSLSGARVRAAPQVFVSGRQVAPASSVGARVSCAAARPLSTVPLQPKARERCMLQPPLSVLSPPQWPPRSAAAGQQVGCKLTRRTLRAAFHTKVSQCATGALCCKSPHQFIYIRQP